MIGRHVGELMRRGGVDAPFANVKGFLSAPDLTIANLECPTVPTDQFRLPASNNQDLNLTADAKHLPAVKRAGIDIVSLANNHAYDAGVAGLKATIEQVRNVGLVPIGLDREGKQDAYLTDVKGIRIAFLAYADFLNIPGTGVSHIRQNVEADRKRVTDDITRARKQADIVVVFWHWGPEYAVQPSSGQKSLAQLSVDAGADLVIGAHPHVAQGMEVKGKSTRPQIVTYSLGNALFDQYFSLEVRQGLALDVRVDRAGVKSARLIALENRRVGTGYTMNVAEDTPGQTAIVRASRSTPDDLEWNVMWDGAQGQPGLAIAYRRPDTVGGRVALAELGLDADTRVNLNNNTLEVSKLAAVAVPTPTRPPATSTFATRGSRNEWRTVWQSEEGWRVTGYTVGDVDSDGQKDLVYTLWKRQLTWSRPPEGGMEVQQQGGDLLPHIYVNTWKRNGLVPLWHGSPRPAPLLSVSVAPIARGGKPVLATLESADAKVEKAPGTLRLWQWSGSFGFELLTAVTGSYKESWSDGKVLLFR
jgi:poly-gamma-glutamate synthesis protein (capsule biosynthesis protein)